MEIGLIEVEHVSNNQQKTDILTMTLGKIKFKEMRELTGVQELSKTEFKFRGENVGLSLKKKINLRYKLKT